MLRNKIFFVLIVFLLSTSLVVAQEKQSNREQSDLITKKISEEHKTTRQYFQQELTRNKKDFLKEFTNRADYYENVFTNTIKYGVLKLGLLVGGAWLFIAGVTGLVRLRIEKKRHLQLKDYLKSAVVNELKQEYVILPKEYGDRVKQTMSDSGNSGNIMDKLKNKYESNKQQQQNEKQNVDKEDNSNNESVVNSQENLNKKPKGFFAKIKQKKLQKKYNKLKKEQEKLKRQMGDK